MQFERLDTIGSTMDVDRPSRTLVIADRQTNGRGTHGRKWDCGYGNLMMTLTLNALDIMDTIDLLPLVVGNAMVGAIGAGQLKWPNDLMFGSSKCGGVLIEISGPLVKIGVGVNIANSPAQTRARYGVTCLDEVCEEKFEPVCLGKSISGLIVDWVDGGRDRQSVLQLWKLNSWWKPTHKGRPVRLLDDGRLVVSKDDAEKVLDFRSG